MPEFLEPGVYIEEVPGGSVPIAGVATSTGAVIGLTQRGPVDTPTLVTSVHDFREVFGGPMPQSTLWYAVAGFFDNGGRRLYVNRVVPDGFTGVDDDDPARRTGIYAFKNIGGMLTIAMPGVTDTATQAAILAMCRSEKYKFAILDPVATTTPDDVIAQRGNYDSEYGALYYPWLVVPDPFPPDPRNVGTVTVPPSGHVMGIYARCDIERGVHKAPANRVVVGAIDLTHQGGESTQKILNPLGINVIRDLRESNRGLLVWGTRTLSSDPEWKYVNIRRLAQYIEASVECGTQWVAFEPNNEPLWRRVRDSVSNFLIETWRTGAFTGTTASEAFFVRCDRTTMTQGDIDSGRLIVEIGIAPIHPAEFVIIRIGQWTASRQGC